MRVLAGAETLGAAIAGRPEQADRVRLSLAPLRRGRSERGLGRKYPGVARHPPSQQNSGPQR